MPMTFSAKPARAILGICSMPEPNTIAFGGVATGSMKAQLAASVTGTVMTIGSKPDSMAMAPTTGRKVAVVAILLVSSVRKMIIVAARMTMTASLQGVGALPLAVIVILAATMIIFLTELTSNIATTATFLPVVGAIAIESGFDPIVITVPVTLAASCAFMLPVATPPNAIVFGSGMLQIPRMARAGIALNVIGIFLVSFVALTLAPRIF